jgi:LPXTG-motif cell wall-anchored protein
MADLPKTGDPIFVYIGSAAASAAGFVGLVLGKKKEETEE